MSKLNRIVPKGLYAITDSGLIGETLIDSVEAAIHGGASVIQYRDKSDDQQRRIDEAMALQQLCHHHEVLFVINDDLALATQIDADGLHIGQDDGSLLEARQQLGVDTIIGVSCYNSLELAITAQEAGADSIAVGRFFTSNIKPNAVGANTKLLKRAIEHINLPVVAIGGITAENGAQLVEAGADMLAVISDIFDRATTTEITTAAQRFQPIFSI